MLVLGIETSCDETAVAVYAPDRGVVAHTVFSQIDLHAQYGGVVPELASRDHVRRLLPLVRATIASAGSVPGDIDGIAYTAGPGLVGALLVGAALARSVAWSWGIPAIGVHHLEAHLLAPMLEARRPEFPFLAILVSGGHTMLVEVRAVGQYRVLGETLDDAVGEAFDKTAKLLGLPYPGGPALERLARQGNSGRFEFPRPMTGRPGLDFSFSGLKTHAVTTLHKHRGLPGIDVDIASAFQRAVVETLAIKCGRALSQTGFSSLVVAGGVGANQALRERLKELCVKQGVTVYYPRPEYCTDNGAMIAYTGWLRLKSGQRESMAFRAVDRWSLEDLPGVG